MSSRIKPAQCWRGVRPFALRSSASAIAICVACSAGAPDEGGAEHAHLEDELGDVVYQGKVTDEALLRLLDHELQAEVEPRVSVCSMAAGATVTPDTPVEFSLSTSGCALAPDPSPNRHAWNSSTQPAEEPVLSILVGALVPIGVAHAHGAPFNGTAYYLRVVDAHGVVSMQAFTDAMTYTPNQAQWARMVESTGPLRLEIVWAEFDNNEVAGSGPFEAQPVSFQLQK